MNIKSPKIKENGFTLIEVLIAAVILFSAVSITAELFNSSTFTSNKVAEKAYLYQITPTAISAIKSDLQNKSREQKLPEYSGNMAIAGIQFDWRAQRLSFNARPKQLEEDFEPPKQFGLYNVSVIAVAIDGKPLLFSFKASTW